MLKPLIATACLCVVGWTAYSLGIAGVDYFDQQQRNTLRAESWTGCMNQMMDIPGSLNNRYETRYKRCTALGYRP